MAAELQSILEKINSDGIKKAQLEHDKIVASAQAEAEKIINQARQDAEEMHKHAVADAQSLQSRAESAIQQAARDLVLKLKAELENRVQTAVAGAAEQALSPQFMATLIKELAAKFAVDPDAQITVLAAAKDQAQLDQELKNALKASLKAQPKVLADGNLQGGVEVSFRDNELYFDFSVEAITELVAQYTAPRIAKIFAGETK